MTEEQLKNIPMKEVIGYNTKMYDEYTRKFRKGGGGDMEWKQFSNTKPMVKKFNEMYLSDVWDKQTKKDAHHMTWNELFNNFLTNKVW